MKKTDIKKLEDKDLQLRYYLGGLKYISDGEKQLCNYWNCDINCSCTEVDDDERLQEVKNFIKKHNMSNQLFLSLSYCYLVGRIMKYKEIYSPLFIELDDVLKPYNFIHSNSGEIPDNDFRQKELEKIVYAPIVKNFCAKYQITTTDFISLAKTSLNYRFIGLHIGKDSNCMFSEELYDIIDSYNLYVSHEYIKEYQEEYKKNQEKTHLLKKQRTSKK